MRDRFYQPLLFLIKEKYMKENVKFTKVMPTSNSVTAPDSLNILVGAVNKTENILHINTVIWGKAENEWKKLISCGSDLEPSEHKHLYFNIPAECFTSQYWNLNELEEIELYASENRPSENVKGILIFVKNQR